ncbi:hypothetical protein V8E36_003264 [Tilletia maclaganii]
MSAAHTATAMATVEDPAEWWQQAAAVQQQHQQHITSRAPDPQAGIIEHQQQHIAGGSNGSNVDDGGSAPSYADTSGLEVAASTPAAPKPAPAPPRQHKAPRKPRANESGLICRTCGTSDTILWRYKLDHKYGPLCNSCGLKHHRAFKLASAGGSSTGSGSGATAAGEGAADGGQLTAGLQGQDGSGAGGGTLTSRAAAPPKSRKRKRADAASASEPSQQSALDAASVLAAAVAEAAFGQILPNEAGPSSQQSHMHPAGVNGHPANDEGTGGNASKSRSGGTTTHSTPTITPTIPTVTGIPRRRGPGNMSVPKNVTTGHICRDCGVTESSLWRYKSHPTVGPLCNGCGLKLFRKLNGKDPPIVGETSRLDADGVVRVEVPPKVKNKKRHKVAHLLTGVSLPAQPGTSSALDSIQPVHPPRLANHQTRAAGSGTPAEHQSSQGGHEQEPEQSQDGMSFLPPTHAPDQNHHDTRSSEHDALVPPPPPPGQELASGEAEAQHYGQDVLDQAVTVGNTGSAPALSDAGNPMEATGTEQPYYGQLPLPGQPGADNDTNVGPNRGAANTEFDAGLAAAAEAQAHSPTTLHHHQVSDEGAALAAAAAAQAQAQVDADAQAAQEEAVQGFLAVWQQEAARDAAEAVAAAAVAAAAAAAAGGGDGDAA